MFNPIDWWERRAKRRQITVIGTVTYRGHQQISTLHDKKFFHIVVFKIDGNAVRSVSIQNHGSDHQYHSELNEEVAHWINLGRLPKNAILADTERAAQFKLFWG